MHINNPIRLANPTLLYEYKDSYSTKTTKDLVLDKL